MKKIIFHHPLPLDYTSSVASAIRPIKMIQAFEEIGYDVFLITGFSNERRSKINELKLKIKNGGEYEFLYSESSTLPTLLTNNNRIPSFPFLDYSFFNYIKGNNIPIGLFYRDIYWKFTNELTLRSRIKYFFSEFFFKYDLKWYKKTVDKLYLPSLQMYDYIAEYFPKSIVSELPPGHNKKNTIKSTCYSYEIGNKLRILYVGGLSNHYQMHNFFKAVSGMQHIEFTICTREVEWNKIKHEYTEFMSSNIRIVHKSGDELPELYKRCDVVSIFVKGSEYWSFAAPLKLYEYLGEAKPIIAVDNTLAGNFVDDNKIGWKIPYTSEDLSNLLEFIQAHPEELMEKALNCSAVSRVNTWEARAKEVESDLLNI